jgi:hypothetical protein
MIHRAMKRGALRMDLTKTGIQTDSNSTANPEPHVEPPRPPGWKPLVLTPKPFASQEEVRHEATERMSEWAKDQEDYTKRRFQEVEAKKASRR